jgi:hypothetical protein
VRLGRYPLLVVDLCRHRDYAEAAGGCRLGLPISDGVLGIVTGFPGTRGSCREGGSGRAVLLLVW